MDDARTEDARVAAVRSYQLLDRPRPVVLDQLASVAGALFETPMAAVSLIDSDRQWFVGQSGLAVPETPRAESFCAHTLPDKKMLVVPDARLDERFAGYPNVAGAPHIRFYAGAPIVDEDGYALGAVCVVDDRPREDFDRGLDRLTALASQAVGHFALIRSRLRLAELDQELARATQREEDLVASISHELRTPVTAIQGYLEILADHGDPLVRAMMDPIRRNGERLVSTVDHLLAGSRSSTAPAAVAMDPLDLKTVAEAAVGSCADLAHQRGVSLRLGPGASVATVADVVSLRQAVAHLVRNAVQFTSPGGHVLVEVSGDPQPTVRVLDDGLGIPAEELPYVCERFFRGRHAREQAAPGLGLGLYIVRRLVAGHGGGLRLTSTSAGTAAVITLPVTA